jgi:hypothetical protein
MYEEQSNVKNNDNNNKDNPEDLYASYKTFNAYKIKFKLLLNIREREKAVETSAYVSLENNCKYDERDFISHTHKHTRSLSYRQNGIVFERKEHMKRDYNVRMKEKKP